MIFCINKSYCIKINYFAINPEIRNHNLQGITVFASGYENVENNVQFCIQVHLLKEYFY